MNLGSNFGKTKVVTCIEKLFHKIWVEPIDFKSPEADAVWDGTLLDDADLCAAARRWSLYGRKGRTVLRTWRAMARTAQRQCKCTTQG